MNCPFCNYQDSRVLESRLSQENSIRRRRECEKCGKRFTTYERLEAMQTLVIKHSGRREPYSREKFRAGIVRAAIKTTITADQIEGLVDAVENELVALNKQEVKTSFLGDLALARLKDLDQVAYVRFASVYRQFKSIKDFIEELKVLQTE
jgi:transcriptional repressor NrdR